MDLGDQRTSTGIMKHSFPTLVTSLVPHAPLNTAGNSPRGHPTTAAVALVLPVFQNLISTVFMGPDTEL